MPGIDISSLVPFGGGPATVIPALCAITGAHLSAKEQQVIKALTPAALREHCNIEQNMLDPTQAALVLTSSISMQIPVEPMKAVREASPPPGYLPRTPFPVTIFELYDEDGDHNRFTYMNNGDIVTEVIAIAIAESDPGSEWLTWVFTSNYDRGHPGITPGFAAIPVRMIADGTTIRTDPANPEDADDHKGWMVRGDPLACCQLATARGAIHVPVASHTSRQQRRAYERNLGWKPPKMYHLNIGGSHEPERREGSREYTCRWLVRGHWRDIGHGRNTWVRPYIKGPIDAPFKGRPSYTVVDQG